MHSTFVYSIRAAFGFTAEQYTLTQLRYDLGKTKGHGLWERDGQRYCYRLTDKGKRAAARFVLFHRRIRGPPANPLFPHRPEKTAKPPAKIETACHQADAAIPKLADLAAAQSRPIAATPSVRPPGSSRRPMAKSRRLIR